MRVLVTGGAGYIGSAVVSHLVRSKFDVTVLDALLFRSITALSGVWNEPNFRFVSADIRDESAIRAALSGQEAVVHLASIVGDPACARHPELAEDINLNGSRTLVEQAKHAGVKRFVFASTCSNYGRTANDYPVNEQTALNPRSLYARTKVAAETLILEEQDEVFAPVVLRLATAFGSAPRMRFDLTVNQFAMEAFVDRRLEVFGGQFWRPYAHVRDIAAGVQTVLEADRQAIAGEVFNLGSDVNNFRKSEIAKLAVDLTPGTEIVSIHVQDDPRSYRVDFAKIKNRLGFTAAFNVTDGIAEILQLLGHEAFAAPKGEAYTNLQELNEKWLVKCAAAREA